MVSPSQVLLAGGVRGSELYSSSDGGRNWISVSVPLPSGVATPLESFISLPSFSDAQHGLFSITYVVDSKSTVFASYVTDNQGSTWHMQTIGTQLPVGHKVASSVVGSTVITAFHHPDHKLVVGSIVSQRSSPISAIGLPVYFSILDIAFSDELHGWLLASGSHCASFRSNCSTETVILGTSDGGATVTTLFKGASLNSGSSRVSPLNSAPAFNQRSSTTLEQSLISPAYGIAPNGNSPPFTATYQNVNGMDSCNNMPWAELEAMGGYALGG